MQQPYTVPPTVYPLAQSTPSLATVDVGLLVSSITHLCDERQRLQLEFVRFNTEQLMRQVAELSQRMQVVQVQLAAEQQWRQFIAVPDEADDDPEEAWLELQELRAWKRQFAMVQTRNLMDRVQELNDKVHRLEETQVRE